MSIDWGAFGAMSDVELSALITDAFGELDVMPVSDVDSCIAFEESGVGNDAV
jgi:hypothetical protein